MWTTIKAGSNITDSAVGDYCTVWEASVLKNDVLSSTGEEDVEIIRKISMNI